MFLTSFVALSPHVRRCLVLSYRIADRYTFTAAEEDDEDEEEDDDDDDDDDE